MELLPVALFIDWWTIPGHAALEVFDGTSMLGNLWVLDSYILIGAFHLVGC